MAFWIKFSVLFMLISLFFHYSSSINKDVKSTTSDFTPSDDGPVGDPDVAETQQVSLITTIEYMPVEAKEAPEQGEDLALQKTEEKEAVTGADEESSSVNAHLKESSQKKEDESRGNKRSKKTRQESRSGSKQDRLKVPRDKKVGAPRQQDHGRGRNNKQDSRDIGKKYLQERKENVPDSTPDLKDDLELDSGDVFNATQGKDRAQLDGKKIAQINKQQGGKDHKKATDIESSSPKAETSQNNREEFRERRMRRKKRGSTIAHETSEGNEHTIDRGNRNDALPKEKKNESNSNVKSVRVVVRKRKLRPRRNDAQDKETKKEKNESLKEEPKEGGQKYGERKRRQKIRTQVEVDEETSQSDKTQPQTAKTTKRKKRRRPARRNTEEIIDKDASTMDSLKKELEGDELKYGEKIITKKTKPIKRMPRQEKVQPLEKAETAQRRQRKIRHKNESAKERKQRKINTALHGKPLSIFVRKEDLHKMKNYKKKGGKYGGQAKHYKKHHKSPKHLLYEENNEIWNDVSDKDDRTTLKKPLVVAKATADVYSSKESTSAENDQGSKSYLNPIPLLKKEKTQQISLVSDVEMEHSSTEKGREPKSSGYKHEEAHKAVQYKASGEKVAKGEHSSSGYKNKHQGNHGKSHHSKFHDNGAQDDSGHHFQKEYHGKYDAGKKKSKGHAKGSKGEHEKGFNNKGFKNLHHKLEYSSRQKYYDEDEATKYLKAADDFDSFFDKHVNSYNDHHKHLDDSRHNKHGYEEFNFDKEFENYMKKHKDVYKHQDYHGDHHHHGNKRKYTNHHYHHRHHWRK